MKHGRPHGLEPGALDQLRCQHDEQLSLIRLYQHTALAIRVWRVPLREGATPVFGS
jgi:hypothetical protein